MDQRKERIDYHDEGGGKMAGCQCETAGARMDQDTVPEGLIPIGDLEGIPEEELKFLVASKITHGNWVNGQQDGVLEVAYFATRG